ncbi:tumor protein p53 inducible nuclear protein 2 [Elysia marginata]|uniref:Tumor protein p53 inducible nuclear protein 2 n=1 Tax=Elysia marginata TaxID=1093978 RepID=A0AAV4GE12_9GAST|nr:tumor protein p53 inducible nuclear protein 2 [Elysia marginata]
MLNSVAKYLWGSSSDEQGPVSRDGQIQGQQHQESAAEEHLPIHHDDDWVVVGLDGLDKENNCDKNSSHSRIYHHHHHVPHPNLAHNNHHHHYSPQSGQAEANSCGGNSNAGAEAESLDEAASLVHRVGYSGSDGQDGPAYLDLDSNYSSDTESSPESVFSACSGRSHATYHPRGTSSEPWVIAPPPCFTGSQVGTLSPVAASPLENLLIEHPSMSVYLSVPHSALPASHPYLFNTSPTGESTLLEEASSFSQDLNNTEAAAKLMESSRAPNTDPAAHVLSRLNMPAAPSNRLRSGGVVHHETVSQKEIARVTRAAQQLQSCKAQKMITAQRCERQNKVREVNSHPKGKSNNSRNKRQQASGAKCSRYSQRV